MGPRQAARAAVEGMCAAAERVCAGAERFPRRKREGSPCPDHRVRGLRGALGSLRLHLIKTTTFLE